MNPKCAQCGGGCCSFRSMRVAYGVLPAGGKLPYMRDLLKKDGSWPRARWFLVRHHGRHKLLLFDCLERTADGRCGIYRDRPPMCRGFRCEALEGKVTVSLLHSLYGIRSEGPASRWATKPRDITRSVLAHLRALAKAGATGTSAMPAGGDTRNDASASRSRRAGSVGWVTAADGPRPTTM